MRFRASLSVALLFSASLSAQDPSRGGLLVEGLQALQRNELEDAQAKLEAASKLDPQDGRIWLGLAEVYRLSDEPNKAEDAILEALNLSEDQPEILRAAAFYFDKAGDSGRAAKALAQYARNYPEDPEPFYFAAKYYFEDGQPYLAIEFALSALERKKDGRTYNVLGKAYGQRGEAEKSIEALREAVSRQQYDEAMHVDLGDALLEMGQYEQALKAFQDARQVFDKSAAIELGLARAYRALDRYEQAVEHASRTLIFEPESKQAKELLSEVQSKASREDLAQKSQSP